MMEQQELNSSNQLRMQHSKRRVHQRNNCIFNIKIMKNEMLNYNCSMKKKKKKKKIGSKDCKATKGHTIDSVSIDSASIHPTFLLEKPYERGDFLHFKRYKIYERNEDLCNFCIVSPHKHSGQAVQIDYSCSQDFSYCSSLMILVDQCAA